MSEFLVRRPRRAPTHPGALLREDVLPATGLTVSDAARRLKVSRQTLHKLLREAAAVSPDMAVRLGALFGNDAALWLGMQSAHDLWHARRRLAQDAAQIAAIAAE